MSIVLLDDNTISKISAGEIIENPASVVKELLENSIDAGAKNITVEVKNSPTDFIRITDDGCGFKADEIELAFMRHSTSKLSKIEDLEELTTLGFRGEALASISSIAKIRLLTKNSEDLAGTSTKIENGKIIEQSNVGMPHGSTFYVEDIFYNTPVRKKFLRADNVEFNLIFDVIQKITLGNPQVSISYIRDGKTLLNSYKNSNYKNHILNVLGREIATNLIENSFSSDNYKIRAYFSNNKLFRSSRNHQYIYINGRYVTNREISREIEKVYKSLIPLNRFPVFILFIDINSSLIDVNIHPKKHEVKLSNENNLIAILCEMVEEVLYPNRSIREIEDEPKVNLNVFDIFDDKSNDNLINFKEPAYEPGDNDIKEFDIDSQSFHENYQPFDMNKENLDNNNDIDNIDDKTEDFNNDYISILEQFKEDSFLNDKEVIDSNLINTRIVGILFDTFIILENKNKDLIYLVDQHAAHERVMYEKYKKQYLNSNINSQVLLKPEIIELNASEYMKIEKNFHLFKDLGFSIDSFGENSIILREVPMIFGFPTYVSFIRDIIDSLDDKIYSNYQADMWKVMKRACLKAVKAGDTLSNMEVKELINSLIHCENPYTCPHGRPTIIDIKKTTIAKLFLRE
ncbi:DNA mismatch repair endonuclease MutL [Peptoniphilus lacrimalis]|uniref:DNA mismatch repair endonuclease MutL n=1 Tax=Peptoniphilus lacrimalis TaxID=33031 RepID=UPI0023F6522F|nr:DNA mismatch repair endonuclease MutL [Peptoniphilus lacrimalis]MDK7722003.1 DNA mismatch repair endonuclease MutL [Peptoniphilus lacrimalis]MDK7731751.1 DNA mismatch repair endonuclease MutL [Peptoniphilus lacrimalis]